MSLTQIGPRGYGSPLIVHGPSIRSKLLTLSLSFTLLLACAKGASRPEAPTGVLHYPAWIATAGNQLLVVNLDQDLAYDNGALVAVDAGTGAIAAGVVVPAMAGQVLALDEATAGPCAGAFRGGPNGHVLPLALVAGRFEDELFEIPLDGDGKPAGSVRLHLDPFAASVPFGVGYGCGADGRPRAWVSYQSIQDDNGFVSQVDLAAERNAAGSVVQVAVGKGAARSFAFDAAHDRLYFTTKEFERKAPLRWIDVGSGCLPFEGGVQDERRGGCHVDEGYDLGRLLRGAEPNDLALSSQELPCTTGSRTGNCRRVYLSVRMYDADLADFIDGRPAADIGGKLVVLELPEGGLGRPEPQLVTAVDIGRIAGDVLVIPRAGRPDLVAVTAVDDDLLWLYDDELGAMVKVIGRDASGVTPLGHLPSGIAARDMGGGVVRLFVTSYQDNWISAVDVPLDAPGSAAVVPDPASPGRPWHLGVAP